MNEIFNNNCYDDVDADDDNDDNTDNDDNDDDDDDKGDYDDNDDLMMIMTIMTRVMITMMIIVSVRNRTAKRSSVTNVTGLLLARFVGNSLNIDVFCSSSKRYV